MKFSVTERGTFRRCRRQATLTAKNGLHLTPIFSPLNLNTGSIVHRAHQLWLNSPTVPLPTHALTASVEAQDKVETNYRRAIGTAPSESEMSETHEAIAMAVAMCEAYYIKYGTPLPKEYRLVAAEQKIEVVVPGTHHILQGKVDGLIQHIPTGRYDILEHKTYKNRPKLQDLLFNDQFISYAWLVWKLNMSPDLPQIAYDGMWRRADVPRGRTFDDLFARYMLTRTLYELQTFEKYLARELEDMAMTYINPTLHAYPNRQWNGCWDCRVSKICDAMTKGDNYEAIIKSQFTQRTDDDDEVDEVASDNAA